MSYIYQTNCYFGIFYDSSLIDQVDYFCRDTEFKSIYGGACDYKTDKFHLYPGTNSDIGDATRGFIFVEEMTFLGPEFEYPEQCFIDLEPREQHKAEMRNQSAVFTLNKLYEFLVIKFKKHKLDPQNLRMGWSTLTCTWDHDTEDVDDSSTEEDSE